MYMVTYTCYRCGLSTEIRTHMQKHLIRKHPCKPNLRDINVLDYSSDILARRDFSETCFCEKKSKIRPISSHFVPSRKDFQEIAKKPVFCCEFCNKGYGQKQHLTRHLKTCKLRPSELCLSEFGNTHSIVSDLNDIIKSQNRQLEHFHNNSQYGCSSTQTNNVQININVDKNRLDYKNTNYDILSDDDIKHAISHTKRCLQELIPRIHFNPSHPENQNVYVSCLKSAIAMLFENSRWNAHMWNDVADRIIDDNIVTIQEWIRVNGDEHPQLATKFESFMTERDNSGELFISDIKRDIKMILYNNRKLVHSDNTVRYLQNLDDKS